jgi:uncharacterized protein YutE (UPF0331/DUF86 family)
MTNPMEPEYVHAMQEHVGQLAEELGELQRLASESNSLPPLRYRAAERNLQRLTEACIGIAKQKLKALGLVVPSESRQAFAKLVAMGEDHSGTPWNKVIGLRNALVHDDLNLDAGIVNEVIREGHYRRLLAFAREQLAE